MAYTSVSRHSHISLISRASTSQVSVLRMAIVLLFPRSGSLWRGPHIMQLESFTRREFHVSKWRQRFVFLLASVLAWRKKLGNYCMPELSFLEWQGSFVFSMVIQAWNYIEVTTSVALGKIS